MLRAASTWAVGARSGPRADDLSTRRAALPYAALFVVCLVLHLGLATVGWGNSLSDRHEFRQTQTAISVYYLVRDGLRLDYETPVLGAPWSMPFEFPLYQWIVAGLVLLSGMPLEQAGRLLSLVCFYATLVPTYALLGHFVPARPHRLVFLALLLASPFYVFWSRAFLIESLALLLSLSFLALAARALERPGLVVSGLAALVGALAALVKVTTFVVFGAPAGVLLLAAWARARGNPVLLRQRARSLVLDLATLGLPLLAGVAWTRYADQVRGQNPMATFTLSREVGSWMFGTLNQRLAPETWLQVYSHSVPFLVGSGLVVLIGAILAILAGRRRLEAALCLAFFLVGPLVFTNLYYVHDYYFYANGIFLLAALGFAAVGVCESGRFRVATGLLVVCALLVPMYVMYLRSYHLLQREDFSAGRDFGQVVRSWIPDEDGVLLIYGMDWNPALPYYAERRALMDRDALPLGDPRIEAALRELGEGRIAAMVIGSQLEPGPGFVEARVARFGLQPEPVVRSAAVALFVRDGAPERSGLDQSAASR